MNTRSFEYIAGQILASPDNFNHLPEHQRFKAEIRLTHLVDRLTRTKQETSLIISALRKATYNADPRIVWRALDSLRRRKDFTREVCHNAGRMLRLDCDNAKQSAIDYLIDAHFYAYVELVRPLMKAMPECLSYPAKRYVELAEDGDYNLFEAKDG